MELRSGHVYCTMAHNKQAFFEAVASLADLYNKAGDLINDVRMLLSLNLYYLMLTLLMNIYILRALA